MGNATSSPRKSSSSSSRRGSGKSRRRDGGGATTGAAGDVAARAQKVVGESVQHLSANLQSSIKKLEDDDHPAAQFLDSVCGNYLDPGRGTSRNNSFYSEDYDDETLSEVDDETTTTTDYRDRKSRRSRRRDEPSVGESTSYGESDLESEDRRRKKKIEATVTSESYESEESSRKQGVVTQVGEINASSASLGKPLASSFAKRCYFTKAGIGKTTQHYEGLTLTGNVVLMLAAAMKLKGCPTICDEDLRRVEQTYPNQFSRLPDELLLSSGWRRISKYCHFSNKPIPDGVPFFHSKQRLHPSGGYYFLLAAAVGMVRPIDVEPLNRDTLVLLETDYPSGCDAAPAILIKDPDQWTLVDKFCFFSGGPINTEEDVYYQADFDANPIFMLAFLSPSLTPEELYKLDVDTGEHGLLTSAAVEEVESVYDLTGRDFDDLRLYHLGPCRALPPYVLQPSGWTKVLPPHFLAARQSALLRAGELERHAGFAPLSPPQNQLVLASDIPQHPQHGSPYPEAAMVPFAQPAAPLQPLPAYTYPPVQLAAPPVGLMDGAEYTEEAPMDEAMLGEQSQSNTPGRLMAMEPPDEPPSLSKRTPPHSPEVTNTFSSGGPLATYSPSEHLGEEEVQQGESYEETEFYSSTNPSKSESHDYYVNDGREGGYYASHSESALSPGEYGSNMMQQDQPAQPFDFSEPSDHDLTQQQLGRPPTSPQSQTGSEPVSHTSSAMRGAQELLKRNRQKRLELAARRSGGMAVKTAQSSLLHIDPVLREMEKDDLSPQSATTWESSSDVTSVVSGTSSAWTDASNGDRSSRRALILQMAKARMKKNNKMEGKLISDPIAEDEEEKKLDSAGDDLLELNLSRTGSLNETGTDIDIAEDLD